MLIAEKHAYQAHEPSTLAVLRCGLSGRQCQRHRGHRMGHVPLMHRRSNFCHCAQHGVRWHASVNPAALGQSKDRGKYDGTSLRRFWDVKLDPSWVTRIAVCMEGPTADSCPSFTRNRRPYIGFKKKSSSATFD